jgi:hypothetical protein
MFIPDPGSEFFHPGSRISGQKDPGSASKNLNIFNAKNCFYALGKMIWDDNPGSGFFSHSRSRTPIPDPTAKKAPDPGSTTLAGSYMAGAGYVLVPTLAL